jgi:cation/acetate symporter
VSPETNSAEYWLLGISPEGIGSLGAVINFVLALVISRCTAPAPDHVMALVDNIRIPKGVSEPQNH